MRRFFILLLAFALICAGISGYLAYQIFMVPVAPAQPVVVKVPAGSSLQQVARKLEQQGVIRYHLALRILARLKQPGAQIQAGSYRFAEPARPDTILARLIAGDVEKVSLTIPEGFTLQQIISRIAQAGFADEDKLNQLAHDGEFIKSLKITADSLEGYLFPETYLFAPGIDEKSLLRMMVSQFRHNLRGDLLAAAKKHNFNLHQLVTLASIIEKETAKIDEMPLISSVFHNRLRRRIPLQTDPTVIYGIADFDGNLTRKHLKTPGPYNTYLNRGLPPGPIANPGVEALQAAAHPATTKYLYFVARGDGSHQFSRTLKEHNAAVRKYQLRRKKR